MSVYVHRSKDEYCSGMHILVHTTPPPLLCATVENQMQVMFLETKAKGRRKAKVPPIALSHVLTKAVENGRGKKKGGD